MDVGLCAHHRTGRRRDHCAGLAARFQGWRVELQEQSDCSRSSERLGLGSFSSRAADSVSEWRQGVLEATEFLYACTCTAFIPGILK